LENYGLGKLRSWKILVRLAICVLTKPLADDAKCSRRNIFTASRVYAVDDQAQDREQVCFLKHYTLTFDVKAADLTDISMEEPVV
jgi:hypothetical protein